MKKYNKFIAMFTTSCMIAVPFATTNQVFANENKNAWVYENGSFYYYGNDGKKYTGWHYMSEKENEKTPHWSYFGNDGAIRTGWQYLDEKDGQDTPHWSYFGKNGWLRTGWHYLDEKEGQDTPHWSYFGKNGWLRTGWHYLDEKEGQDIPHWSYFGKNGWLRTGLRWLDQSEGQNIPHYSYFGDNGWLRTNETLTLGNIKYLADSKGWLTVIPDKKNENTENNKKPENNENIENNENTESGKDTESYATWQSRIISEIIKPDMPNFTKVSTVLNFIRKNFMLNSSINSYEDMYRQKQGSQDAAISMAGSFFSELNFKTFTEEVNEPSGKEIYHNVVIDGKNYLFNVVPKSIDDDGFIFLAQFQKPNDAIEKLKDEVFEGLKSYKDGPANEEINGSGQIQIGFAAKNQLLSKNATKRIDVLVYNVKIKNITSSNTDILDFSPIKNSEPIFDEETNKLLFYSNSESPIKNVGTVLVTVSLEDGTILTYNLDIVE